jgi:subtilase family serine protease
MKKFYIVFFIFFLLIFMPIKSQADNEPDTPKKITHIGKQQLYNHIPKFREKVVRGSRFDRKKSLKVGISLPIKNQDALINLLKQLYDPSNPQYRHYLNTQQFTESFAPSEQDYQQLIDFFTSRGIKITEKLDNRMMLSVEGSPTDIENAFNVEIYEYTREDGSSFHAPDRDPSIDSDVKLLHIFNLDDYDVPKPATPIRTKPAISGSGTGSCSGCYIGADVRNAYAPGVVLEGDGQISSIIAGDGYLQSDITLYENIVGLPDVILQNITVNGFDGIIHSPGPGGVNSEVCLDIEQQISMAPGLSKLLIYESTNSVRD